ncbi:hypothetical protein EV683_1241 [Crenobacter luteus]|uniref:hypothetical protein n=1 Tax=Crenobacter luteus TaxID=1452487 RepID=UPI00104524CC|nr:hypothetical protein [Crenobacter luteus]TCP10305.1 hypothetical protein EV683_1241 [Crenobacter luteus]
MPRDLIISFEAISYDLLAPGQKHELIVEKLQSLGAWVRLNPHLWYVRSEYTAEQAAALLWDEMDDNDQLFVTEMSQAAWRNLGPDVESFVFGHAEAARA